MTQETYGWLSILPPLLAIVLAIRTRQVIPSLLFGLLTGYLIISKGNLTEGFSGFIESLVNVFASAGNTRTVIFTLLIGALIQLIRYSGGVAGFVWRIQRRVMKSKRPKSALQVAASLTGFLIFIESNISILTVGTIFQPLFRRFGIAKEKLAYIADSSSAPSCILFPLNAWGAYIVGLLAAYEGITPFEALLYSIPFNFYPILTLLLVFYLAFTNRSYGPMKSYEQPVHYTDEETSEPEKTGAARLMLIPLLVMVLSMPIFLVATGWQTASDLSFKEQIWSAIANGSGSAAVLYAIVAALAVAGVYYALLKKVTLQSFMDQSLTGMGEMLTMAILMVLAFAIGEMCKELGTGIYVANAISEWMAPGLIPVLVFLTSCFIAFSTGTSWGTFAIMISIAVPLAQVTGVNLYLTLAAVLGGGVFGDHCSPISDTTLIASMASGSDHIDHVRTQLPYALFTGALAAILYLVAGFIL